MPGLLKLVAEKTLSELFGLGRYLPEEFRQRMVKDLWSGEIMYVVPWSVSKDSEGNYFISPEFSCHDHIYGTSTLRIKKNKLTVSIQDTDLQFNASHIETYTNLNGIPVKIENACLTKLIRDLAEGEVAYTSSGAINPDMSGRLYVLGNYSASSVSNGGENIKIKKMGSLILIDKFTLGSNKYTLSSIKPSDDCIPAALALFI